MELEILKYSSGSRTSSRLRTRPTQFPPSSVSSVLPARERAVSLMQSWMRRGRREQFQHTLNFPSLLSILLLMDGLPDWYPPAGSARALLQQPRSRTTTQTTPTSCTAPRLNLSARTSGPANSRTFWVISSTAPETFLRNATTLTLRLDLHTARSRLLIHT